MGSRGWDSFVSEGPCFVTYRSQAGGLSLHLELDRGKLKAFQNSRFSEHEGTFLFPEEESTGKSQFLWQLEMREEPPKPPDLTFWHAQHHPPRVRGWQVQLLDFWCQGCYVKLLLHVNAAVFACGFHDGRRPREAGAPNTPTGSSGGGRPARKHQTQPRREVPAEHPHVRALTVVKVIKTEA